MRRKLFNILMIVTMLGSILSVLPVSANPPAPDDRISYPPRTSDIAVKPSVTIQTDKPIDQPNLKDYWQNRARQRQLEKGVPTEGILAQTGTDRVLVILVEFAGTDVFTWTAPITPTDPTTGSQWDPLGIADPNEYTGVLGDCSNIITQTTVFTYQGPLHNEIPRPLSAADRSGESIWSPDFDSTWFYDFMFGNGVVISYTRQDSSSVYENFIGKSVSEFYGDLSSNVYTVTGDVVGWVSVPHSTWYYDADRCPGARSGGSGRGGLTPGGGTARTMVQDALDAVNAISNTIPGFSWYNYDQDDDGIIDRLWIVHAGYGEEESPTLLNRDPITTTGTTFYGESAVWSHSSSGSPYTVTTGISGTIYAGPYIVMPENGGIGVFAHEYGHNLGADDLYSYGDAETSAGFWTTMADDWTGYPIGFQPPSMDPWHLDNWGWLNPYVINDPTQVYTVTLGQGSYFSTNSAPGTAYRAAKIELPDQMIDLQQYVPLWQGNYYWWGGNESPANAMMTTASTVAVPAGATLSFEMAYGLETEWDFLWVQVSTDLGATWDTLTNTHTTCTHASGWIGFYNGMEGECGFTDYNASFPDPDTETFDLSAYAGQDILLRFWHMTDWNTIYEGPFIDNVQITGVFSDDAESGDAKWTYAAPWIRSDGSYAITHNYYAQWRNVNANGGYDNALGDPRYRYGPVNTGLLVWYNNNAYNINDVWNPNTGYMTLNDDPGFGPKGRMLVVDSHYDPYREPALVADGYDNEAGNVAHRSLMRDAPFTLVDTVDFTMTNSYPYTTTVFTTQFAGRPAVSSFNDALGYYPGAENVPGGPVGQTTPRWMTKQWDASVVIPAKAHYGIKAPGYTVGTRMRFECGQNTIGQVLCYSYSNLGYDGTDGNPGSINAQYGWQIELIEEGPDHTWATVRVYNTLAEFNTTHTTAVAPRATEEYTVNYQTVVANSGGTVINNIALTYTLDAALTAVGQTSWTGITLNPGEAITLNVVANGTAGMTPATLSTQLDAFDGSMAAGPWAFTTDVNPTYDATLLHTNDFHGNLEFPGGTSSTPGMARTAYVINQVRTEVGAGKVALLDAGDIMQGTLLSNLFKGESTIDVYANCVGYDAATFGNHEFDWGQTVLLSRTQEATFPFLSANIVVSDTGNCTTAGWTSPAFAQPWMTMTVGTPGNEVVVGLVGVTSQETPYITIASATEGLCFKDPAESISHYYNDMINAGADVIVVLSHIGNTDGGYGYGFDVYGDQTLATMLQDAGTPAHLIIGGHSHTNLEAAQDINGTLVVQAHYAGRKVGRADIIINDGEPVITWQRLTVSTSGDQDPAVQACINTWASDPWYQGQVNQVIGYTNVDLVRNYNGDSTMGAFVNDAIYSDLNTDAEPLNDVDVVFNNPGGLRADITFPITATWPQTLTHGMLYSVLPFGNATIVGDMTGAQIQDLLNQSATLFKGALQVSGIRYTFYRYTDTLPGPQPWAWGAYSITVKSRTTSLYEPLVMTKTYRIATNEFLAPAGQDGFVPFKYVTNYTYWGDMLDGVERWVTKTYTIGTPYNGTLDGRITRNGDDTSGDVIPVTVLHHNDSHGRLVDYVSSSKTYPGYTRLASLIKQERAHNPSRTILLNAGDTIQGDAMMAFYKTAFTGFGSDGTTLPVTLTVNPIVAAMNAMTYTAMTLGNHEYNFGHYIFTGTIGQANFPTLQANVYDDGQYGLGEIPVLPYVTTTLPGPVGDISLAILGLGNHRVPNYELPSNIPGLSFTNPITEAQARVPALEANNDAVIALTHIGFTQDPNSIEVDDNVDTELAKQVTGVDAIIGGHSHTDPSKGFGNYKYLPAVVGNPDNTPVLINQAYRYNNYLGEVALGLLPDGSGGYNVVARAGRYVQSTTSTPEDAAIKAIVKPYDDFLTTYKTRVVGQTIVPIDETLAFTTETNAANLQVDASIWKLNKELSPTVKVDFHLSGAMSNGKIASTATATNPYTMTINDMFTLMPYENSLVVLRMNGPQLKTVLERAYRNYYYYQYVPGQGGYSYYTTCMLDINKGGQITYRDTYPNLPNGNNVASLVINGNAVNFIDATKYYTVSTVNYLAAGSCNFSDGGVTLWPLNQIVADTQYYVRDVVVEYVPTLPQPIAPAIEGRLVFQAFSHSIYLPLVFKNY